LSRDTAGQASVSLADLTARFSLAWLVAANLVGLLLAALLLWPNLGDALIPLTYGRWMPVHQNAQLYGWCALPLVGLLLRAFLVPGRAADRHTLLALGAWSAALAFGAFSWLRGEASGKLFLDWTGSARIAFPAALCVLWAVLAHHAGLRLAASRAPESGPDRSCVAPAALDSRRSTLVKFLVVAALLLVPTVMHFSAGPRTFPPVNPDSGGATGVSLYGSTLGLLLVFAAMPWMVSLPLRPDARRARLTWPVLGAALVVFGFANHGHGSHHDRDQIITLGLLFLAPPLLARDWRRFVWKPEARGWLIASLAWSALLVADGWLTFLPGFSERLKFTNALVAHSHLAMAGLLTSMNMVFLLHLGDSPRVARALGARTPFWLWQLAAAVHIGVLLAFGWFEGASPALVVGGSETERMVYLLRLLAGAAMAVASIWWLSALFSRPAPPRADTNVTQ
jgi:cytochrome c oxidase cbb3-type subunit 1